MRPAGTGPRPRNPGARTHSTAFDVVVLGGGPAGVVSASVLARHGYRTALVATPRRYRAIEGLSERALAGLRFAGCRQALQTLGPQVKRHAHWNGRSFEGNTEWVLERGSFDEALCEDARRAGIAMIAGRVVGLEQCGERWSLRLAGRGFGAPTAGFVIDARGRAAPQARGMRRQHGPAMVALGRLWQLPRNTVPVTCVASFADGWVWFAAGPAGIGVLQIFVTTQSRGLPPRPRLADHYHRLLSNVPEAQDWLAAARPQGPVLARDAHPRLADPLPSMNYARAGDAAYAIDPLSGHGMYESIGGALALAATVHTLLARPADADAAERFYRERIESDFLRMSRIGRDFYRMERRWPERPFWRERQAWPDEEPAHAPPEASAPRMEYRPVNADGLISLHEVIVTADHPRGIWQVAGIPLAPLLRQFRGQWGESLAIFASGYALRHGLTPQACQTALAWLAARGLLTGSRD